ncbi:MAG: OB-fold nucleic acid binding domain-containing protein [Kiritimatiellia bacterium]
MKRAKGPRNTNASVCPSLQKDALCPSCERFIGPVEVCPYCGCDSARGSVYRWLRRVALALACGGVGLLLIVARRSEVPTLSIGSITPRMNFASVCIRGRIVRNPYVSLRSGQPSYLSFVVNDGTGELRVVAYGKVATELVQKNLLPRSGSQIRVVGSLLISDRNSIRLRINRPNALHAERDAESDTGQTEGEASTP